MIKLEGTISYVKIRYNSTEAEELFFRRNDNRLTFWRFCQRAAVEVPDAELPSSVSGERTEERRIRHIVGGMTRAVSHSCHIMVSARE